MKHPENFASQKPNNVDQLSDIMQDLRLMKERIIVLEASVFGTPQNLVPDVSVFGSPQNLLPNVPVGHEQAYLMRVHVAEIADVQDAHITVQGTNIAIAIRSPSSQRTSNVCTSAPPSLPISTPSSPPPSQIPSQTIGPSSSWGPMMMPGEVQELLASQPQIGEYYVVIKGRKPGVYLYWPDAHELIDGLRSPCYFKKTDKYAALGQYTLAYKKGNCEYRFH